MELQPASPKTPTELLPRIFSLLNYERESEIKSLGIAI